MWRLPMLLTYAWNRAKIRGLEPDQAKTPGRIKVRPVFIATDFVAA